MKRNTNNKILKLHNIHVTFHAVWVSAFSWWVLFLWGLCVCLVLVRQRPFKWDWASLAQTAPRGRQDLLIPTPALVKLKRASNASSTCSFSISEAERMIYFDKMSDKIKCDVLGKGFWQQKVLKTEGGKDWVPELWLELDFNNSHLINWWMGKQNVYPHNETLFGNERNKIRIDSIA